MSITRKDKISVGSSLPTRPADKDLAVNSVTGEVKVYNKSTNSWSLIGDGAGASLPDVSNSYGKYLSVDQNGYVVWAPIPTPTPTFVSYELYYSESATRLSSTTFDVEAAMVDLVGNGDSAFRGKHFIFNLPMGSNVMTAQFSGDAIGATNPYSDALFKVTIVDSLNGDGQIQGTVNTPFGIIGSQQYGIAGGRTATFTYLDTGSSTFLIVAG